MSKQVKARVVCMNVLYAIFSRYVVILCKSVNQKRRLKQKRRKNDIQQLMNNYELEPAAALKEKTGFFD